MKKVVIFSMIAVLLNVLSMTQAAPGTTQCTYAWNDTAFVFEHAENGSTKVSGIHCHLASDHGDSLELMKLLRQFKRSGNIRTVIAVHNLCLS